MWELLRDQLRGHDLLVANLRVTDERKDHEADLVVALPGAGIAVVEVKGGSVGHDGEHWQQTRSNGSHKRIDPVEQARDAKYAVRRYVEQDPRWRDSGRSRLRWAHVVVLPGSGTVTSPCRTARPASSPTGTSWTTWRRASPRPRSA